ncbi:MAG: hypothetical protein HON43_08205 [Alphaproteobacteria bacterium]|jgi:hypothetical protein|nr:hypothetical protein [Alphaproteobacteria bacterium]MBT5389739.1 hypothetical protein [Alphaproteobacteria bacterium]
MKRLIVASLLALVVSVDGYAKRNAPDVEETDGGGNKRGRATSSSSAEHDEVTNKEDLWRRWKILVECYGADVFQPESSGLPPLLWRGAVQTKLLISGSRGCPDELEKELESRQLTDDYFSG